MSQLQCGDNIHRLMARRCSVAETDTVGDLKALVFSQTTVPPERQKIIGLAKGKLSDDDVTIAQLQLHEKAGKEFTVIGESSGWQCPLFKVDRRFRHPAGQRVHDEASGRTQRTCR